MLADLARSNLDERDMQVKACTAAEGAALKLPPREGGAPAGPGYTIQYFGPDGKPIKGQFRYRHQITAIEHGPLKGTKLRKYNQPAKTPPWVYWPRPGGFDWRSYFKKDRDERKEKTRYILYVTEGEKKAAAACKAGYPCIGLGGMFSFQSKARAWKLLPELETLDWPSIDLVIVPDATKVPNPDVIRAANRLARYVADRGASVKILQLPLNGKDEMKLDDYLASDYGNATLDTLLAKTPRWGQFDPDRPMVMLKGKERSVSEVAEELGRHLHNAPIFIHGTDVVTVHGAGMRVMKPPSFISWAERYVVCAKQKKDERPMGCSMTEAEAKELLASEQFREQLRPLERVHTTRLPVLRSDETIALLKEGYDEETATLTLDLVKIDERMSMKRSREVFNDLFGNYLFEDGERSYSIAVSITLGMFAEGLMEPRSKPPVHIVTKNRPGAGASTLAALAIGMIHGIPATRTSMPERDEMRKLLFTVAREGKPYLLLDNATTKIGGAALENFTSAPRYGDRILGISESGEYPIHTTVVVTVNGGETTASIERRSLVTVMHQKLENPGDRTWKYTVAELEKMRPQILSACWAMVHNWDEKGRPAPSLTNSNFPEWSQAVGGIMEAAGYSSPLEPLSVPLDEDQKAMRALVKVMKHEEQYAPKQMIAMCQENGLFLSLVGERNAFSTLQPWQLAKFGKLLTSYNDCMVGTARFRCEGEYHAKRYWAIKESEGKKAKKRPQTRMPIGDARSARSVQGPETTLQAKKAGYVN